jgi:pimeloyl-ACP methyl ester carboxylesterase
LSDRGIAAGTLDDEVRDLAAVVDAAGLGRFALLGRSQGAAIAIRYAAMHPDRVGKLVTLGGYVRGWVKRAGLAPDSEQIRAYRGLIEHGWGQNNEAFQQLVTSEMFPGASAQQRQAFMTMQRMACTPADAACLGRMMSEYDVSADLSHVRCPALVMHSSDDRCVPFEQSRLIASGIRDARFEPLACINHTPLPDEPAFAEMNRQIDEFLLQTPAVRSIGPSLERPQLRVVSAVRSRR